MTTVLHVATRFLAAGSERSIADLIAATRGPDVRHVLAVGREHQPDSIRALCGDIEWHEVPHLVRRPGTPDDIRALSELRRLMARVRPDVVHTIQSKSGILGRTAARGPGSSRRRPATVHSVVMANFGPGFGTVGSIVYRTAERVAARWTDQYLVNGLELRDRFLGAGIARRERFEVIRTSVDSTTFRTAAAAGRRLSRMAIGLPAEVPIVLFAGSLDHRKGAHHLPAYLASVRRDRPDALLVIAGEGPLRGSLESEMARRGLGEASRFVGFTPRLPELMAACDALVMLSRAEGMAMVLVHAAAAGRPFVATRVDGPGELIALGASGRIVPIDDIESAARATDEVLDLEPSRPLELADWAPAEVRRRYREVLGRWLPGATAGSADPGDATP